MLLILTDDQGYGVPGTFGGVIPTPALDRIAKAGLRYTQVCSTALCSPSRAALISGRNHHSVGFGVITELSTGYPGYDSIIGTDQATVGNILKGNGYATSWFGKNHNTPSFQYGASGPFDQWPSGMGFDYFYGFMGGETDQWTPYLFRDHTQINPWVGRTDYNLTTDMADEAVKYLHQINAAAIAATTTIAPAAWTKGSTSTATVIPRAVAIAMITLTRSIPARRRCAISPTTTVTLSSTKVSTAMATASPRARATATT